MNIEAPTRTHRHVAEPAAIAPCDDLDSELAEIDDRTVKLALRSHIHNHKHAVRQRLSKRVS